MLHIILGILKIIGILLGVLFLLLLSGLLAVVFVPLRYRLSAKVQPERQYAVALRLSWLLHALSAEVSLDASQGQKIAVRLFGIRLPLFRRDSGRKKGVQDRKKAPTEAESDHTEPDRTESDCRESDLTKPNYTGQNRTEASRTEADHAGPGLDQMEERPGFGEEDPDGTGQKDGSQQNILQKIWFACRRICDKIKQIPQRIRRFFQKLADLKRRMAGLRQKGISMLRKPGELLEFLEEYEAREVFGSLVGHLVFLIAHYKPHTIRGYVRFGTGDPSTTGQLTGLIYILLPARADRFSIEPEFNEAVFETDADCSGHIRALHMIRVLWRGFRDKKLRRIITAYRGTRRRS